MKLIIFGTLSLSLLIFFWLKDNKRKDMLKRCKKIQRIIEEHNDNGDEAALRLYNELMELVYKYAFIPIEYEMRTLVDLARIAYFQRYKYQEWYQLQHTNLQAEAQKNRGAGEDEDNNYKRAIRYSSLRLLQYQKEIDEFKMKWRIRLEP